MTKTSLILIDPQVGFCSASGSLARYYGYEEMSKINEALAKLEKALNEAQRTHLVTSQYFPGQFTDGDLGHPLASLCVPMANDDCKLVDRLVKINFNSHSTKNETSAMSCKEFKEQIEKDLNQGTRNFVISGFLFEHCVKTTALELWEIASTWNVDVYVSSDLTASRLTKYANGEVQATIDCLRSSGVGYEPWQSIAL
jgi:nicotinamidase-related amidase